MGLDTAFFAATAAEAEQRYVEFGNAITRYRGDRNKVTANHRNVSRLSPAIRHRLITEFEVIDRTLTNHAFGQVEKFVQEVAWRLYWKGWLSLRPQIWRDFLDDLAELQHGWATDRIDAIVAGQTSIEVMGYFARELVETGYLHNHARMWFAGWWVHVERLPWQLGADFFYRHLLDADAASNTLSWRWVAGLQTRGKSYLPRRSNLEKYLADGILASHGGGLEQLNNPRAMIADEDELIRSREITRPFLTQSSHEPRQQSKRFGLIVHREDLKPEAGPLQHAKPDSVLVLDHRSQGEQAGDSSCKLAWITTAQTDTLKRLTNYYDTAQVSLGGFLPIDQQIRDWCSEQQIDQVSVMRPEVGPLADALTATFDEISGHVTVCWVDRPEDLEARQLATGGFFGFWKKYEKLLRQRNRAG